MEIVVQINEAAGKRRSFSQSVVIQPINAINNAVSPDSWSGIELFGRWMLGIYASNVQIIAAYYASASHLGNCSSERHRICQMCP